MKRLFTSVFVLFLMIALQSFAQTKTVEFADTVSNSKSKSVEITVDGTVDSVKVSLFASGEIDIDSLDVKLGVITPRFEYQGYRQELTYWGSTNTTYSKTLTINLDSAATSYTVGSTTIPKSALAGYNLMKLTATAASAGNDATDPKQKLLIIVEKY